MQRDTELSSTEKLARRQERTNDDGTVDVEVIDWQEENGTVTIDFYTPVNNKESDTMEFPTAGGDLQRYKFYRILQSHDLDVRNAELLSGKMVKADVTNGDWTLVCGRQHSTLERVKRSFNEATPRKETVVELIVAITWVNIMLVFAILVITA